MKLLKALKFTERQQKKLSKSLNPCNINVKESVGRYRKREKEKAMQTDRLRYGKRESVLYRKIERNKRGEIKTQGEMV